MAVTNFDFRKNWVGSEVTSMKKAFFAIFGPIWAHNLAPTGPKWDSLNRILVFNP